MLDKITAEQTIDTVITHTSPSFCELQNKNGLYRWTNNDTQLLVDVQQERETMDSIHHMLKEKQNITHWCYGHFHQSWHNNIDGILFKMLDIMEDQTWDKEIRLSAIRYFGRYPYEPALGPLLAFAGNDAPERWEYATVSASSLANYQGERVIRVLKKALHSSNWYVRYAAAASLEAHHMNYEDLLDVVSGSDRYAREMMAYQMESHRMQEAGV